MSRSLASASLQSAKFVTRATTKAMFAAISMSLLVGGSALFSLSANAAIVDSIEFYNTAQNLRQRLMVLIKAVPDQTGSALVKTTKSGAPRRMRPLVHCLFADFIPKDLIRTFLPLRQVNAIYLKTTKFATVR